MNQVSVTLSAVLKAFIFRLGAIRKYVFWTWGLFRWCCWLLNNSQQWLCYFFFGKACGVLVNLEHLVVSKGNTSRYIYLRMTTSLHDHNFWFDEEATSLQWCENSCWYMKLQNGPTFSAFPGCRCRAAVEDEMMDDGSVHNVFICGTQAVVWQRRLCIFFFYADRWSATSRSPQTVVPFGQNPNWPVVESETGCLSRSVALGWTNNLSSTKKPQPFAPGQLEPSSQQRPSGGASGRISALRIML